MDMDSGCEKCLEAGSDCSTSAPIEFWSIRKLPLDISSACIFLMLISSVTVFKEN